MELGVACSIGTKSFQTERFTIDTYINEWLEENPDIEIIDIKFTSVMYRDQWESEALVIYRKEM